MRYVRYTQVPTVTPNALARLTKKARARKAAELASGAEMQPGGSDSEESDSEESDADGAGARVEQVLEAEAPKKKKKKKKKRPVTTE